MSCNYCCIKLLTVQDLDLMNSTLTIIIQYVSINKRRLLHLPLAFNSYLLDLSYLDHFLKPNDDQCLKPHHKIIDSSRSRLRQQTILFQWSVVFGIGIDISLLISSLGIDNCKKIYSQFQQILMCTRYERSAVKRAVAKT